MVNTMIKVKPRHTKVCNSCGGLRAEDFLFLNERRQIGNGNVPKMRTSQQVTIRSVTLPNRRGGRVQSLF